MPTSEPLDILLAFDTWATEEILRACESLSEEQFGRQFQIGVGSLQLTIEHVLWATRVWTDTLAGWPAGTRVDPVGVKRPVGELQRMLGETAAAFVAEARRRPLDEVVTRVRQGKESPYTRGGIITHVTTHGMHHRAQCLNMLRHLGVQPLPASSVAEWMRRVDFAT